MSNIAKHDAGLPALQMREEELMAVLQTSLYPGADPASIKMVLGYCKASGLDPMQKPVHIVPMWDSKSGRNRDVVMPGIGLYRTQAARNGCAGVTEPEFGPDVTENIGGAQITYPAWCRVTVKRRLATGEVVEFTAKEFWKENYAVKGGKERSIAPNAMWAKRPYGQIAKCAEAQALRKAFPEIGSEATADEMAGKSLNDDFVDANTGEITRATFDLASEQAQADKLTKIDDLREFLRGALARAVAAKDKAGGTAIKAHVLGLVEKLKSADVVDVEAKPEPTFPQMDEHADFVEAMQ